MNRALVSLSVLVSISVFSSLGIAAIRYVDGSVSQSGDGQSWETAFTTIQEGMDAASDGDTVIVAPGVYVENISFGGKNIVVTSTDVLDPDVVQSTIIDGNQAGSVATFDGTENDTCVLSGFTIRNGKADQGGGICGGSRYAHTTALIENNVIEGNSALDIGGGVAFSDGVIQGNTVSNNFADLEGGGLYSCNGTVLHNAVAENDAMRGGGLASCQATIDGNIVSHNTASEAGGALYRCDRTIRNNEITRSFAPSGGALAHCDGLILRNLISANDSYGGGALYDCDGDIDSNTVTGNSGTGLRECNGTIQNNIISHNEHKGSGGLYGCSGLIQNNTVVYNSAAGAGGGLFGCAGIIVNCVIWGNEPQAETQVFWSSEPTYSCIQNWTGGGQGNISEDPRFVDADGPDGRLSTYRDNDYRLLSDSPCIDAGFYAPGLPAEDIAGMRRIMYGGKSLTVDMGAYEYYINELQRGPGGGEATLTWSSIAGSTYLILYSEDLLAWILAEAGVPSAGNQTTSWTDDGTFTGVPPSLAPRRFYRVLENP